MPPRDHFQGATLEQWMALFGELTNASDRVTAIAAAAFLDDTLGAAMLARFVAAGVTWKDRVFSSQNAPLGSFYSKAVMGYALGLFGPLTYADLNIIRQVRNAFAHTATPLQFADDEIGEMCVRLTSHTRVARGLGTPYAIETGPKADFVNTVYSIAINLIGQMRNVPPRPSHPSILP